MSRDLNKRCAAFVGGMLALGGFGIVYRAWDKKLDAMLAIKEYYPSGIVNRLPGETNLILATPAENRAAPKSKSFMVPLLQIMMLSGLTSRWRMFSL